MNEDLQTAAEQLHDAATQLLLSLWDAEEDRHPDTGQMYSACAQAWLAIHEYRKVSGTHEGSVSSQILQEAVEVSEENT